MKRLLLFLCFALFVSYISFAQVPANDLIENAIEIDPSNYSEENIRLDLTTTTGVEPGGCGTGAFTKVYYKFTTTTNGIVSATVSDMISDPITQSFVIFYTASDLNQTDETQLNVASDCVFDISGTLSATAGQSYYLQVHRIDANALSKITFSFASPPLNDLIENAIEITGSSFSDENLRIDLAAINGGGQGGCDINGFNTVYYKFTANTNGTATFYLFNQESGPNPVNSFVIIYSAPNLNATSDTELTLVSNCDFNTQPSISITSGQSYYALVHRPVEQVELSRVGATISQDGTPEERQALIDLYNSADGPNWFFNTNWNTSAPLSDWTNVTVENGHVVSVVIATFGATGTLPSSLSDLTFLERADFRSNNLFGEAPDLSSISTLIDYNVNQNKFSVGDLETHFTNNSTITNFSYTSQSTVDSAINFEPTIGSNYTLSVTPDTGTNISYQWYKDRGTIDQNILISGATNSTYNLTNIQSEDLDTYICEITSSSIPDLTILRLPINLTGPVSQIERDALIAFYNALDGDNWTDNTNWLSSEPVGNWSFITTRGNKVIKINIFGDANLNGELPTEIGDLIHLEILSIGLEEGLTGPIPSSIGNLAELQRLRIQLTGNTETIPSSIGNLSNLWELRIIATNMTGNLPSTMGNLSSLTDMTLFGQRVFASGQNFTGTIPTSFSNLTNLGKLDLRGNSFEGQIPSSLSNLTELSQLLLNDNDLSGSLPDLTSFSNPLEFISISLENNYFDFSDLEPLVNNGVTYGFLSYSPQRTLDQEQEIESVPGVDITLDINDTNINRDSNDTAMNNNYQWFKDNAVISGANDSSYTLFNAQESDSGVYYCEITNTTLPNLVIVRANITLIIDASLGVNEIANKDFKMHPNPATNWLTIQLQNPINAKITIYDLNGRLILENTIQTEITSFAVDKLQAGTYLISVTSNNASTTKRFIKQ